MPLMHYINAVHNHMLSLGRLNAQEERWDSWSPGGCDRVLANKGVLIF